MKQQKCSAHYYALIIKKFMVVPICTLVMCFSSALTYASDSYSAAYYAFPVSGRVTNPANEPLARVTVQERGTTNATVTDEGGNFSITVADTNAVLIFSYAGLATQEITVGNRSAINVQLHATGGDLNEVVVIGYQTVRRKDLTGSTAVVNTQQAQRVTANSVGEQIQGLAPGVTVRTGGSPGQNPVIEIRGVSSFTSSAPLFVVDGMIADANSTVNPNDIESIQVLKDASAAAIYGSRAANGVIIVTTRQGREGTPKVTLSAKYGIQNIPKRYDVMNAAEFAATQKQQYINSGLPPLRSVDAGFNPNIDTDWQDVMYQTGIMSDYNISLSGGSRASTFLISASYFKNKGVIINHDFERSSLRINTKTTRGRFTIGENMMLSHNTQRVPAGGNPFYDMPQMLPVIPVQSEAFVDPSQGGDNPEGYGVPTNDAISYAWNPYAVNQLWRRNSSFSRLVGNGYADVKLTNWLNYRFNVGADVSFDNVQTLRKQGRWSFIHSYINANVDQNRSRFYSLLLEHTLNFNKTFGKHSVNGVVGFSDQQFQRDGVTGGRNGLQQVGGQYFTTISSATGTPIAFGDISRYRLNGYLGRINYSYNDKYLVTFSGRLDQDSRFGEDYRNGFFPSVAASWRISQENFFNVPWISDLKIRGSYGLLGIVTSGPWEYIGLLNNNPRVVFGPNQQVFVGATQARLANPDLRWEERLSSNIGFDANLLNNRITVTADAYRSEARDVLVNLPLALYLGNAGGDPLVNAASIENKGIELAVTYRNNQNAFKYDVSANLTTIKNEVLSVGNRGEGINYIQLGGLTRQQVGHPMSEWYLLKDLGLFQSTAEINAHVDKNGKVIQPNAKPGDVKYQDTNGDGQITDDDRAFVGTPWPKLQTGAQFNASFKGFTFNLQLVGVFGYKVFNDVYRIMQSYHHTNFLRSVNPWTPTNTNTNDFRLAIGTGGDLGVADNIRFSSSRWLSDAGYLRIRNLEIGYNLPTNLLERVHISNARVYVSGQNLYTFTKYTGLDPDVQGPGSFPFNILERGFDAGNWPASRVISIGFNCDF